MRADGWKNKGGTCERSCKCGTWKQHWVNNSGKSWPDKCSISGCNNAATLGAHIYNINKDTSGEHIVPACNLCNNSKSEFSLKDKTTLVSANQQKTCAQ